MRILALQRTEKKPMKVQTVLAAAVAVALGTSSIAQATAPCTTAAQYSISCYPPDVISLTPPAGPQTFVLPKWTLGNYGTTAAAVSANFAYVQFENFTNNVQANAMVTAMTNDMIARLSTAMAGSVYEAPMLEAAARRLSNANLRRLQGAFGLTPLQTATIAAGVYQSYKVTLKAGALPGSAWWHGIEGTPVPVYSGQWLYDLFLDHYTGTLESVQTALHQSMLYGQARIHAGPIEIIGVVASALGIIQFFDPNAWSDLKGWISEQYNNAKQAIPTNPFVVVTPFPQGGNVDGGPNPAPDPEDGTTELSPPGSSEMGVACHREGVFQC